MGHICLCISVKVPHKILIKKKIFKVKHPSLDKHEDIISLMKMNDRILLLSTRIVIIIFNGCESSGNFERMKIYGGIIALTKEKLTFFHRDQSFFSIIKYIYVLDNGYINIM